LSTATATRRTVYCLTDLNRRLSTRGVEAWLAAAVFMVSLMAFLIPSARQGSLSAPPEVGDAHDYDAIAQQLVKGRGFSVDWDDPAYRKPYEQANHTGTYDSLLERHGASPTAYRSPLLPVLMAGSYAILGRSFAPVRVMNATFMALACTLAFSLTFRYLGALPAALQSTLFLYDSRPHAYATMMLTESLSSLLVVAVCWCLLRLSETRARKWAVLLGVSYGAAILTRTILALWLPVILVLTYALARPADSDWIGGRAMRLTGLMLAAISVLLLPWGIRNSLLLGRFSPLGTQGAINLAAGYSDEAVANRGNWFSQSKAGLFDDVLSPSQSPLQRELAMAEDSSRRASQWLRSNAHKVPRLAYYKGRSLWRPRGSLQMGLLVGCTLGFMLLAQIEFRAALVFLSILAVNTAAVAATWTVGDRFTVPVLPLMTVLSAAGLWGLIVAATELPLQRLEPQRGRVAKPRSSYPDPLSPNPTPAPPPQSSYVGVQSGRSANQGLA
jgi:4-amino-4-deoxy-L-arabinose transferase-like glycosyltransferase